MNYKQQKIDLNIITSVININPLPLHLRCRDHEVGVLKSKTQLYIA